MVNLFGTMLLVGSEGAEALMKHHGPTIAGLESVALVLIVSYTVCHRL